MKGFPAVPCATSCAINILQGLIRAAKVVTFDVVPRHQATEIATDESYSFDIEQTEDNCFTFLPEVAEAEPGPG